MVKAWSAEALGESVVEVRANNVCLANDRPRQDSMRSVGLGWGGSTDVAGAQCRNDEVEEAGSLDVRVLGPSR